MKIDSYNLDEITKQIIIHLSEEGFSFERIAVEMGVTIRTLYRYADRFKLEIQKTNVVGYKIIKPIEKIKRR